MMVAIGVGCVDLGRRAGGPARGGSAFHSTAASRRWAAKCRVGAAPWCCCRMRPDVATTRVLNCGSEEGDKCSWQPLYSFMMYASA